MKKIILFFACLLLICKTYCQVLSDSTSKENSTKTYYLHKSKSQKVGAWTLISAGVIIFAVTGITASHNLDLGGGATRTKHKYAVPIGLSIACAAASIPLFIAAGRNKSKAKRAEAYFKMENIPIFQKTGITFHAYPAISVKLGL